MIAVRPRTATDQVLLLQDFFDRSALARPDAIAVEVPPAAGRRHRRSITYGELKHRSDLLACQIRDTIADASIVAVLLPRTTELLYVAQLAVLKSGAAFLCIDPAFPSEHVRHILDDAEAAVLLTDAEGLERAKQVSYLGPIIHVDPPPVTSSGDTPPCSPSPPRAPEAAAYVIYTSGTTGQPKGVLIAHRSICNLVESDVEEFRLGPSDRVAQGSSAAYDSSVEEAWMAFSTGATLVVMNDETARLGPDLVAWLRDERVTVLCPPPTLLRATGCDDPRTELPDLRLLYVGGEPLPEDVVERWGRGRRMVNGYGPTECTVTCLRADVIPTQRVTIGRPVPGVRAWVLDDDLGPVQDGEPGELCIGGVGLAIGYHRRPELDTERFPEHPQLGRIYRTGDLVQVTPDGTFLYHGRIDSQVKLRGYRIELEAIETCLARCTGVREAACRVQGCGTMQTIAAHIVPWDAAYPPDPDAMRRQLKELLPGYMVPSLFGTLTRLPRSASGKLNRNDLPVLTTGGGRPDTELAPPRTPVEARIAAACQVLSLGDDLSIDDDFFDDLGGSSVQAAMLISELRADPATASLTVRDVYETRTVAELARRAAPAQAEAEAVSLPQALPSATAATAVQVTSLLLELLILSPVAYLVVFQLLPWLTDRTGLMPLILVAPTLLIGLTAAFAPLTVIVAVLAKRVLIGQYEPMRAPVWSSFFVRSWLVQHAVRAIPWRLIEGTEFQCMALRALGARIGRRVHIHRGINLLQGGWDLLEIGDDVTLSQDASLRLVTLEEGHVVVGPITLADGATLDVRSGVGRHAQVGRNSRLSALSALPPGGSIPDGEMWDGIPARHIGSAPEPPSLADGERDLSPIAHGVAMILAVLLFWEVLLLPFQLSAVVVVYWFHLDYNSILAALSHPGAYWVPLSAAAALFTLSLICSVAVEAVAARALGAVADGVISRWSLAYIRVWMKAGFVQSAGNWLSGALFWPVWLRWSGMKIGQGCEISTVIDVVPELIRIGPRSFLADGVYLGGPRVQCGTVTLASVSLQENTFLGNHAVVAGGQRLPRDTLVGICTVADDVVMRPGSSWFGHPQLELSRREIVECGDAVTYNPSLVRLSNRLFWEWLRFALPIIPMLVLVTWVSGLAATGAAMPPVSFVAIGASAVTLGCAMLLCISVLLLKWVLLGRVRPGIHPLWSCWCSRWDFLYLAWGLIASGVLAPLEGTLLLAMYLRRMGMKIGKRVVLGGGFAQVVDPDMIVIEDGATVNAMFQAHTFEDRVLKIDRIRVGSYSTLAENTVPLYGAEIGSQTYVAPHSVIMKHEHLQPGLRYAGAPTRTLQVTRPVGSSVDRVPA